MQRNNETIVQQIHCVCACGAPTRVCECVHLCVHPWNPERLLGIFIYFLLPYPRARLFSQQAMKIHSALSLTAGDRDMQKPHMGSGVLGNPVSFLCLCSILFQLMSNILHPETTFKTQRSPGFKPNETNVSPVLGMKFSFARASLRLPQQRMCCFWENLGYSGETFLVAGALGEGES